MDKYQSATRFYNKYVKLSDSKKEEFSRITNKLLSVNYLCAAKEKDKDDYYYIVANLELFTAYFELMDYSLENHKVDSVVNLYNNQNYNHYSFKKNESVILLLLRKLYFQKMQEISLLEQVVVTVEELHDAISTTGIYEKRMTKTELMDVFRLLRRFNIIDFAGSIGDDANTIIVYPTISYVLAIDKLEQIENIIIDYGKRGEIDEKISEDEAN